MSGFFNQAGLFLVYVVFGFYILTLLLRFLFQLVRADFYNPFAQFVVALTNPPLKPLRRLIPGLFGIDLASVLLLLVLQIAELFLVGWISGRIPPFTLLFAQALIELVKLTLHVFLFAIIIRAVMSWFSPYGLRANPVGALLTDLTEPVMRPARRLIPAVSGIDLSPIVAIVVLQLLVMLLDHLAPALYRLLLGA